MKQKHKDRLDAIGSGLAMMGLGAFLTYLFLTVL